MTGLSVTADELDELGRKLEAADLNDKERRVLLTVFQLAANTISDEEVSGYGLAPPPLAGPMSLGGGLSSLFHNSFVSGPRTEDGPGDGGVHITPTFGSP